MKYDYPQQSFLSKAVLAGVFAGIVATLANLTYDLVFRSATQFVPSQIINVATIIFTTMLVFTVAGVLYFFANKIRQGTLLYIVLFGVLTVLCFSWGLHVRRSPDAKISADFRILLLGIVSITGLLTTFFVPYLMQHQGIFLDEKD